MTASQITDIIGQLTLEEKASLCPGSDAWHLQAIERLGISGPMITDGLHGLRKVSDGSPADIYNSIPATCFPTARRTGVDLEPRPHRRGWSRTRSGDTSRARRCVTQSWYQHEAFSVVRP